ncbi:MAG: enoyl-CoA hydratase/isomerase family protein [Bdellovibrionales bacterium]
MGKVKGQILAPHWLVVTLDSPESGNAFSEEEISGIEEVFERYKGNYKGIIFKSEGRRFFCSGGNLKKYRKMNRKQGLKANRVIRSYLRTLDLLKIPTVAIVDGDCYGGGLELLSVFDHVIATPQSFFGFWQRKISLTFGWEGRLKQRMAEQALRSCSLGARTLPASTALRLGLVDEVAPRSFAMERALHWLNQQSRLSSYPVEF